MPRNKLAEKPDFRRARLARGLKTAPKNLPAVDPEGGDNGAGIIRGMAIITRGEALGHDVWIDSAMLQSVADSINATEGGAKARFTHPSLSGDGLGKFTGRVKNASVDGDIVRGDLHFSQSAHETPDGDLAGYLMKLAVEDPETFGNSIAFAPDFDAEDQFVIDHGGFDAFESPDPLNAKNLPHARMRELRAVDAVDEPAANPSGLFHRGQSVAQEADSLLSWTLGLSDQRPTLTSLAVDPDRVGGFFQRFLDRHGLTISAKEEKPVKLNDSPPPAETKPADQTAETKPGETKPGETKPAETKPAETKPAETKPAEEEKPKELQAGNGDGPKFLSAFGDIGGKWFAEGKTFAQAQELYIEGLKEQVKNLSAERDKLKADIELLKGATTLVPFQAAEPDKTNQTPKANVASGLSEGQQKFAAAIKMPGQS